MRIRSMYIAANQIPSEYICVYKQNHHVTTAAALATVVYQNFSRFEFILQLACTQTALSRSLDFFLGGSSLT